MSCILCLSGVAILNGVSFTNGLCGVGEILCASAGLLYGFNIAGTGVFAKKLYVPLYLAVQAAVGILISLAFSLALNSIMVPSASGAIVPIEKIYFSFDYRHSVFTIFYVVIVSALCWVIRTNCMKHIEANTVSIIMPFSAVVTATLSVITGSDVLNFNLLAGGTLVIASIIISSLGDIKTSNT